MATAPLSVAAKVAAINAVMTGIDRCLQRNDYEAAFAVADQLPDASSKAHGLYKIAAAAKNEQPGPVLASVDAMRGGAQNLIDVFKNGFTPETGRAYLTNLFALNKNLERGKYLDYIIAYCIAQAPEIRQRLDAEAGPVR